MRHLGKPSILGAVLAGVLLIGAAPASAEVTIGVSPAILELEGRGGDAGRIEITVSNQGDEPYDAVTDLLPFESMIDDRSALEWSRVTPDRLHLEPGERAVVTYILDIPDEIASGGRYAAVAVATDPGTPGTGPTMAARIVVPVFLTVHGEGDLDRSTALERSALFLEPDGRLGFRAQVRNDGNVHVPIAGSVTVTARDPAADATLDLVSGRVLPGRTRVYAADATLPLPLGGTYDLTVRLGTGDEDGAMVGDPTHAVDATVDATPVLTVESASVCENLDRGPLLQATLRNGGAIGIVPAVTFQILDASGTAVDSVPGSDRPLAWPDTSTLVTADLGERLDTGAYTLVATASYGGGLTQELRVPFSIGGDPATAAPLCEPVTPTPSPAG